MNAKDYLLQYQEYDRIARICLEEYKSESEMINGLMPYLKKREAELIPMIQFAKSLKARADKARKERDDILNMLNGIPEPERDILHARYINQMKWDDIANKYCYSWTGIFKVHERAIKMLQEILDVKKPATDMRCDL